MILRSFHHRGFTLVELMVSMTIGAIVLLAAATLLGSAGDGYERIGGGVEVEREARALITQLRSDLAAARFHNESVFDRSAMKWPADRLGFLSLQPAGGQSESGRIGDLCAVNYYVKDLTLNGKTTRCLMRGFRESRDTFKALETGMIAQLFAERPGIDEPIAFGVLSFEARPMDRDDPGEWTGWSGSKVNGPQALEVRVVIARRDLAAKLKRKEDWDGSGPAAGWLGEPVDSPRNGDLEVFSTLIRFGNEGKP